MPQPDAEAVRSLCTALVHAVCYRVAAEEHLPGVVWELEQWQACIWDSAAAAACPPSRPASGTATHAPRTSSNNGAPRPAHPTPANPKQHQLVLHPPASSSSSSAPAATAPSAPASQRPEQRTDADHDLGATASPSQQPPQQQQQQQPPSAAADDGSQPQPPWPPWAPAPPVQPPATTNAATPSAARVLSAPAHTAHHRHHHRSHPPHPALPALSAAPTPASLSAAGAAPSPAPLAAPLPRLPSANGPLRAGPGSSALPLLAPAPAAGLSRACSDDQGPQHAALAGDGTPEPEEAAGPAERLVCDQARQSPDAASRELCQAPPRHAAGSLFPLVRHGGAHRTLGLPSRASSSGSGAGSGGGSAATPLRAAGRGSAGAAALASSSGGSEAGWAALFSAAGPYVAPLPSHWLAASAPVPQQRGAGGQAGALQRGGGVASARSAVAGGGRVSSSGGRGGPAGGRTAPVGAAAGALLPLPAPLLAYGRLWGSRRWHKAPLLCSQYEWGASPQSGAGGGASSGGPAGIAQRGGGGGGAPLLGGAAGAGGGSASGPLRPAVGQLQRAGEQQGAASGASFADGAAAGGISGGAFGAVVTKRLRELQRLQMEALQQEVRPTNVRLTGKTVLAAMLAAGGNGSGAAAADANDLDSD